MPRTIAYYAIADPYGRSDRPDGIIRRVRDDEGLVDEEFTRDLRWKFTQELFSYERGATENKIYEITKDEADEIVEWIRRTVTEERHASG
jgi:hypothetical protein